MFGQSDSHRRYDERACTPVVLDAAQEFGQVEGGQDDEPGTGGERGIEQHRHSIDVGELQKRNDDIVGADRLQGQN